LLLKKDSVKAVASPMHRNCFDW